MSRFVENLFLYYFILREIVEMNQHSEQLNGLIADLMVESVESDEAIDDLILLTEIRKVSLSSFYLCVIFIKELLKKN